MAESCVIDRLLKLLNSVTFLENPNQYFGSHGNLNGRSSSWATFVFQMDFCGIILQLIPHAANPLPVGRLWKMEVLRVFLNLAFAQFD